ncbi:MAG: phosphodiester glycosidase family protein [Clostridia bacterium]|nr:phosphodiester glycosidase family protein [Clostridia bacterium]MBP3650869.1 phosphodiester glycosidase family protein [Clostridia bacterium]
MKNRVLLMILLVLAACLLIGCAAAEEVHIPEPIPAELLPQLVPVTFPEGDDFVRPAKPKDNYIPNPAGFSEDGMHYHDDSIDVQAHMIRVYDTPCAVMFVQIADPDQFCTELAKPYPQKATMRIDTMQKRVHAVAAVNGDWFTYHNYGIVYRDGELLRNRAIPEDDGLVVDVNGDLHIIRPMVEEEYAKLEVPIMHSFAFGPALVRDGEVLEIIREVTFKQRMGIGQIAPLTYVLVAADGPDQPDSVGLSVPQLAQLMHDLGAHTAYNLDGGQSTSMMMYDTKINGQAPKTFRAIGDIIYFATAVPSEAE